ncbi:uncharacterized protein LOC6551894 [Drosophila erecta]|uniref:GG17246 n=1 Tax=Drosophila erecta TaxID=7220 RepID=B3NZJ4_DROER|nr:uncharacterized protein LOC6551894 [Drosophila erecta]EDV49567.1 uncharacterized protein Dere_GG17246 [Drosophila erecta]
MLKYTVFVLLAVIPKSLFQRTMSYEAFFVSVLSSENAFPIDFSNLRVLGRERILNGTFDILEDIDNEHYEFYLEAYTNVARDGNYKKFPMALLRDAVCAVYEKYGFYLRDCVKYGINTDLYINTTTCLIPKGRYYLKNVTINVTNWPVIMSRGLCRHSFTFYKDNVAVGTYNITSSIEDRAVNFRK